MLLTPVLQLTFRFAAFAAAGLVLCSAGALAAPASKGTYPHFEATFGLTGITGNPFDFTQNDVKVTFARPDGKSIRLPAFFDGDQTWRVRCTPDVPGRYQLRAITLNGQPVQAVATPAEFVVTGDPTHGFVRVDPRHPMRFAFDNGGPYYPLGHDLAWRNGRGPDLPESLAKMGDNGLNWARIWMCHWGGTNLDWVTDKKIEPGMIDLGVVRRWDRIIAAAEKAGVHVQMTLQHHGQYSSRVNPNWGENPWNKANGGWLEKPGDFFTDARAIALTQAKYRYIISRWGCSPAIFAWELFNEVEWVDPMLDKHPDTVVAWHERMAAFIREQDPYHHLVTTSSTLSPMKLWRSMDYYQPHSYPPDVVSAIAGIDALKLDKPFFIGEIGPGGDRSDHAQVLHRALWASLVSEASGAAQYWYWDVIQDKDLYPEFRAATAFVRQSRLASHPDLRRIDVTVDTTTRGELTFAPGAGWGQVKTTDFTVLPSGRVEGIAGMPSYLHGDFHRPLFPYAAFHVNFATPGSFVVTIGAAAKAGAHVILSVDGAQAAEHIFPASDADTHTEVRIESPVPAGAHIIRVENTGSDWVVIQQFAVNPYVPVLGALGTAEDGFAVLWVEARKGAPAGGATGTVRLPGLEQGAYKITWWDTVRGQPLSQTNVRVEAGGTLRLETPLVEKDAAAWVVKD